MPENPLEEKSKSKNLIFIIGAIALVIAVVGLIAIVILWGNNDKDTNSTNSVSNEISKQNSESNSTNVALVSLGGLSFGPYNSASSMSGDFVFAKDAAISDMIVFPFGQEICEQGNCKILPELGFHGIKLGTKVTAVAPGKVVEVRDQGVNDFAVSTVFDGTDIAMNYDHLSNVTLKVNDTVKAGDTLGEVAPYGGGKYGRYELMIQDASGETKYLCPMEYLEPTVKTKLTADLKQFFTDWNSFYGKTVQDLSAMTTPGCLKSQLKLSEVE